MNYTARQAYNVSTQVLTNQEAVYSLICYQAMESIQRFAEFHFTHCTFHVPRYVVGYAVYDHNNIRKRLKKHLRSLEYRVKNSKEDRNTIIISWSHISKHMLRK